MKGFPSKKYPFSTETFNSFHLRLTLNFLNSLKYLQMEVEAAEKKGVKASKSKSDEVTNVGENDDSAEKDLEELKSRFDQVKIKYPLQ